MTENKRNEVRKSKPTSEKRHFEKYSTTEVILMAVIGAIFGVLTFYNFLITEVLRMAFGLWGGLIVGGIYSAPGVIAFALIKKKGAAFITQNLMGIVQVLLGSPIGFVVLWFTFAQSIGQELTFFLSQYHRPDDWRLWGIAGLMATLFAQIPNYCFYGMGQMPFWSSFVLPVILIGLPSAVFLTIILTKVAVTVFPERFLRF